MSSARDWWTPTQRRGASWEALPGCKASMEPGGRLERAKLSGACGGGPGRARRGPPFGVKRGHGSRWLGAGARASDERDETAVSSGALCRVHGMLRRSNPGRASEARRAAKWRAGAHTARGMRCRETRRHEARGWTRRRRMLGHRRQRRARLRAGLRESSAAVRVSHGRGGGCHVAPS